MQFERQGDCPVLSLQKVPEKKTAKTRVHLDISVKDPDAAAARAEALGATIVHPFDVGGVRRWVVLLDPDGNEFCVVLG